MAGISLFRLATGILLLAIPFSGKLFFKFNQCYVFNSCFQFVKLLRKCERKLILCYNNELFIVLNFLLTSPTIVSLEVIHVVHLWKSPLFPLRATAP